MAQPVIKNFQVGEAEITLTFSDDGSSNQFEVERNPGLDPANWSEDSSATLVALGGGGFSYTIARTAATKEFFRIVGSFLGTGIDRDGDGLPNTLEDSFTADSNSPKYSNPDKFDTDRDGFSDGVEFAYGTDPNDADSVPDKTSLPVVEFASSMSSASEGDGSVTIPLSVSGGFSGSIHYTVNARSTATAAAGDIHALSGTVSAAAGQLVIDLIDDSEISSDRLLVLDLSVDPPGGAYRRGGRATHVLCLSDDDGVWNGSLSDGVSERNFRLQVLHSNGITTAAFVAGAADGTTAPSGVAGSQSEGIVPSDTQGYLALHWGDRYGQPVSCGFAVDARGGGRSHREHCES